ncbi:MAG TPA: YcxB family protein [Chthonomonadales bacterium]|nr:YcxB family protein [Chthonomonadales bacterium]
MNGNGASIRYENELEDLVALNDQMLTHSRTIRRQIALARWTLSAVMSIAVASLVGGLASTYLLPESFHLILSVMAGAMSGIVYFLSYPRVVRRRFRRRVAKMYGEGANKTVLGWHEMELLEDGFRTRTEYTESKTAWGAIEKIESAPGYTYIYIGAHSAHIIPHAKITDGNLRLFLEELGQRYRPDTRLPPAPAPPHLRT